MSRSKWKQYKAGCDEAARKVAAPVLEWLNEQYPDRQFDASYHCTTLPDGPALSTSRISQVGPGLVKKYWPKRIAHIGQFNVHQQDLSRSCDERILPYEKLMELMQSVDILDTWAKNLPARPVRVEERFVDWVEERYGKSTDTR